MATHGINWFAAGVCAIGALTTAASGYAWLALLNAAFVVLNVACALGAFRR